MGGLMEKEIKAFEGTKERDDDAKKRMENMLKNLKYKEYETKDNADNEVEKLRVRAECLKDKREDKDKGFMQKTKAINNRYCDILEETTQVYKPKWRPL